MFPTRAAARRAIEEKRVVVAGIPTPRPATMVDAAVGINLVGEQPRWASRGGTKLAAALDAFALDPEGRRCLDVGASTGGFTHVLLERGAASVAAVDVGYGQLAWRLQADPRVVVHDRTNFRSADPAALGAPFGLVTVDVSFISIALLAASLAACGAAGSDYVVLVKPQFEVGREQVGRGGLVTRPGHHAVAVTRVAGALAAVDIGSLACCPSPITGATGNREFFLHGRLGAAPALDPAHVAEMVRI